MKKSVLNLVIVGVTGLSLNVIAGDLHGSLSGMANAGYATGNYSEGVLLNPSLGANYNPEKDDFAFIIGLGAVANDKDELLDQAEDLSDLLDAIDNSGTITSAQADDVIDRLKNISGDNAGVNLGANVVIAIPNEVVSVSLVADVTGSVSVNPIVDDKDIDYLETFSDLNNRYQAAGGDLDAIDLTGFDFSRIDLDDIVVDENGNLKLDYSTDELKSSIVARGVVVTDIGLAFSKAFQLKDGTTLLVGAKPKKTEVESIIYTQTVANYDEDDFDADEFTVSESAADIDIGVTYIIDKLRYGLVVNNVKGNTFKTIDPTQKVTIDRQYIGSIGYVSGKFKAEAAYDFNAVQVFGFAGESQMLRAGVEYSAWDWLRLRAGYEMEMKDVMDDTYSLGLGVGAFNLAYISGSDNTKGVALSGGIRF